VLSWLRGEQAEKPDGKRAHVAAAALLVECARVDATVDESEERAIAEGLARVFDLDDEVAESLVALAERRLDEVWHDWLFTDAVRRHFDLEERVALVRILCEVAHANGLLHPREDAFVQRIARELGVPDDRFAQCRDAARSDREGAG
jgi:uncharacterized tellurite resistance protein B-like protein